MAYDAASRVTQIGNWDATIKNVYFNDNLLKSQEEWTGDYGDNVHRTVTYAYDADGNRGNIIYPSGKNYSYGYYGRNDLWYVLDNLTGDSGIRGQSTNLDSRRHRPRRRSRLSAGRRRS